MNVRVMSVGEECVRISSARTFGLAAGSLLMMAQIASSSFIVNPSDDDLALWLDASVAGSVITGVISGGMSHDSATFSAGGGTAGNGDPVALWRDQRTPTATNSANDNKNSVFYTPNDGGAGNTNLRPTYVENAFRGKPAIRLNGTDNLLITWDASLPALTDEHTIIVVGRAYSESMSNFDNGSYLAYARYTGNPPSGVPQIGLDIVNTTADEGLRFRIKEPGLDTWSASTTMLEEVDVLMQRRADDGEGAFTVNGLVGGGVSGEPNQLLVSGTSTGSITDDWPGFRIGRHTGGAQFLEADVFEVIVYNRALSDTELNDLKDGLYVKWAIPEPGTGMLVLIGALGLLRWRRR